MMKIALLCVLLAFVAASPFVGPEDMWPLRGDTFVHRTFTSESPDAHYYYLKITRAELLEAGENVHVIVNELSDPDADIKLYIKPNAREELPDLTAEGVRYYEGGHAELVLDAPYPAKSEFSVAVVSPVVGLEYSVSACIGFECSESTTAGLKNMPRHPNFAHPLRPRKAEKHKRHAKRILEPTPDQIRSPMSAVTPATTSTAQAVVHSHDKSGFLSDMWADGDDFVTSCGFVQTQGAFRDFRTVAFTPPDNFVVTYDFGGTFMMNGACFWPGGSADSRVVDITFLASTDGTTFTPVASNVMIPPPAMPETDSAPGIPIMYDSPVSASHIRIVVNMVTSQRAVFFSEFAARIVPPELPPVPICPTANCQCSIMGCTPTATPTINECPGCRFCRGLTPTDPMECDQITPVLGPDMMPINRGDIQVQPIGCVTISTIVENVIGLASGAECVFLMPGAEVLGAITLGNRDDCLVNMGGIINGITNLGAGDDCYYGDMASSSARIVGGGGDDWILVAGGNTQAPGNPQLIATGAGSDCVVVNGGGSGRVGAINGGPDDDCIFLHTGAEGGRIRGFTGQDHIAIDGSTASRIDGDEGDDIIQVNQMSEVDGLVTGGMGFDEIFVMSSDINDPITTETEDDVIVIEGPMANFFRVESGDGNDCMEVRMAEGFFEDGTLNGGLGNDTLWTRDNMNIGNIFGNEDCDIIQSCNNFANSGVGVIQIVDGGDNEDRCFVQDADEVLNCEDSRDCSAFVAPPPP